MKEVKEIYDKINETELMEKIIIELKEKGYSPQGGGAYTIFSADKQMLTLLMYDIDLNNKVMTNDIMAIVDKVIRENNFSSFEIALQKVDR
ncbi:hypothetical protein LZ480_06470 [Solibacillus sp. MA9]|uniref:Uncharacterized protein n=1 Tax=Solibacillus palustris TaxID=2908203 RepID=A0ABS9UC25_9BACL|nr:hypothetical protein [Solibacillus sp. MA9]MCH7321535.1 hypothetical protein [Solibacillus sp. MA9]